MGREIGPFDGDAGREDGTGLRADEDGEVEESTSQEGGDDGSPNSASSLKENVSEENGTGKGGQYASDHNVLDGLGSHLHEDF